MRKDVLCVSAIGGVLIAFMWSWYLILVLGAQEVRQEVIKELIGNPGFEDYEEEEPIYKWENPKFWIAHSGIRPELGVVVDKSIAHSGEKCLRIKPAEENKDAAIYQPSAGVKGIQIKQDKTYIFKCWAKSVGSGAQLILVIYEYNSEGINFNSVAGNEGVWQRLTPEWKEYQMKYKPNPKTLAVACAVHENHGEAFLDDASFKEVEQK